MSRKKTTKQFIEESKKIHGDKYDYSLTLYENNHTKVSITCPIHGQFTVRPNDHLSKKVGCNKCNNGGIGKKNKTKSKILDRFRLIHGDKYDYSLVEYIDFDTKVSILCKTHGVFLQTPHHHVNGSGCAKCAGLNTPTTEEFVEKSKKIHGDDYDYSMVDYKNNRTKVILICKQHGQFEVTPNDNLNKKSGCPICKKSKGEMLVKKFLDENNIKYIQQYTFKDCVNIKPLPFDFYLPYHNVCIEYDGELHFKSVIKFGGDRSLGLTKKRDLIKNKYCLDNNITLIRIPYNNKKPLNELFDFIHK